MSALADTALRPNQLLEAAWQEIATSGFRSVRIADIARRAGVSTGTVHYWFPTKRDILVAAFEHNIELSRRRRAEILGAEPNALGRVRAFIRAYVPDSPLTIDTWRLWIELWNEGLHDPELQAMNQSAYGEWRALFQQLLEEAESAGEVRLGEPSALAHLIVAVIDGFAVQTILGSHDMTPALMRQACEEFLNRWTT